MRAVNAAALLWAIVFLAPLSLCDLDHGYDSVCGNWQDDYKQLHDEIVSGRRTERLAIAYIDGGIADCLSGAISTFYYALLTGRAFKMLGTRWPRAYASPHVDWRDTRDPDYYLRAAATPGSNVSLVVGGWSPKYHDNEMYVAFKSGNLHTFHAASATVFFKANLGLTHALMQNKHHMGELHRMGLRPETAFGCAMAFLFSPHPHIMQPYATIAARLLQPGALSVGVQVRVGDHVLGNAAHVDVSQWGGFFRCARAIARMYRVAPNQSVHYYVVSDSVAVRRAAQAELGAAALTLPVVNHHVSRNESGMQAAAAEHWLLGLCQHFVLSLFSGFGRTAAARSMRWGAVFTLNNRGNDTSACTNPEPYAHWSSSYPPYI